MLLNIYSTSVTLSEENRLKGQFIPKLTALMSFQVIQVWNDMSTMSHWRPKQH